MKELIQLCITALLPLLFSCGSGNEEPLVVQGTTFEIATSDLLQNFEKDRASRTIQVSTDLNRSDWSVKSDAEWMVAGQATSGNAITLTVYESEEPEVREGKITVTSSVKTHTITVKQLGYGPAILLKRNTEAVGYTGGTVDVEVTTNVDYKAEAPSVDWVEEIVTKSRAFVSYTLQYEVQPNPGYAERQAEIVFSDARSGAVEKAKNVTLVLKQDAVPGNPADVEVEGDFKLTVIGGKANQWQANTNNEFEKSYDNDKDTHYHSPWGTGTSWPVVLEYNFDGSKGLDYIVYHSRNGNGNFGRFKLYVATQEEGDYQLVDEYDLKGAGGSTRIDFSSTIQHVTKVKFEVLSGSGDGTGNTYASCAEMEFWLKNTEKALDKQLLSVFTDLTCTELKEGVTEETINSLPPYFGRLAVVVRDGLYSDYERGFRIQEYEPYSVEAEWAERLMIKHYSSLDNPTGITVDKGDEVIILVGNTHGNKVSVRNVGEERTTFGADHEYPQTEAIGTEFMLQEGVNRITADKTGMLFFVYNTDLTSSNAKPIKVHIPVDCGKVGGYWCKEKHATNDNFKDLIDRSDYKYFCVRGNNIILYFHRDKMKAAVNGDIVSAIDLWDDIVGWQHELMGLEDIRFKQWNNHMFAISPEGSYMWASDYRVAFVYTYLNNILIKDNVMAAKDNAWGPAHEIGHIHQRTINWPSCTESSNNLFSNYTLYKLGKYCSRGETLDKLAVYRLVEGDSWYNMGGENAYQNEATEIHMRMHWQLWNYYHRCGYKTDFWPQMFKALRETRIVESDPGAGQLLFAKTACKVANEDLTDFFEIWGFFEPVDNVTYEQYGTWNYNVTSSMISEAKAYMAQFPKANHAFYYLEDRKEGDEGLDVKPGDVGHYEQFKNNQKITKTITCSRSGQNVSIKNGDEAVAFELYLNDKLIYFSNLFNFTVPSSIYLNDNVKVYAVQADGERIEVK